MRTLLLALFAGMISFTAQASQLNIRLTNYGNYTVVFNNTTYFATEKVKIFNIPPGKHYIRIVETLQPRYYGSRSIGKRVIYEGYVTIPPQAAVYSTAGCGYGFEVARIDRFDNVRGGHPGRGHAYGKYKDKDRDRDDDRYDRDDDYSDRYDDRYEGPDNNDSYDDGTWGTSKMVQGNATKPAPAAAGTKK